MKFCSYCEHRGIISNPDAYITGVDPLLPCPRCVTSKCKCGGESPFYYSENSEISECYCRPVRLKIIKINGIYTQSGIEKKYLWRFLNEFNCRNTKDKTAKNYAYDIITKFPDVDKGLFLWGTPGTGKTFLSTIILTELITRYAVSGKFIKVSRTFFGKIKETFNERSEIFGMGPQIEKELSEVDVLIVDDFGTQRETPWEQETLYNLVDSRYEAQKFTIFTSNFDPDKYFKELSEGRILSRIKEMCKLVELSGPDKREEK